MVILSGYNRYTGDLDLWVKASDENYLKLKKAFLSFGLPIEAIEKDEFLDTATNEVFSFGIPPIAIDFLTSVKGLDFEVAFKNSKIYDIEDNLSVRGLSKLDLIKAKIAAGRYKDLDDLKNIK